MPEKPGETVLFEGNEAHATTPEGARKTVKVSDLLNRLAPRVPDTCGTILPDGVKCVVPVPGGLTLVHQTPPQVYSFKWIANDSEAEYGPGTRYRSVRLGLPYMIVFAVFATTGRRGTVLSQRNECFFSNEPLETKGIDTPLHYPALLNCSKLSAEAHPLSWICTQYLDKKEFRARPTMDASLREGLGALLRHLLESGFNRSSEHHEGASGFSASVDAKIDPRIATVDDWEKATHEDPLFVLSVPWLPVGMTVRDATGRIGQLGRSRTSKFDTAADIARVIFNTNARRSSA